MEVEIIIKILDYKFTNTMTCAKKHILLVNILLLTICLKAQDLPVHEQYIFDYMLVNPSFTGITETSTVKLTHRQQWTGIKDAPNSSFLLFRHRLNGRLGGIGGYLYSDQNGANSKYGLQISSSFHLLLKQNRTNKIILSFGMSFRGTIHILDESKFDKSIYDPIINYGQKTSFIPNANFGILLSTTTAFIGYSTDNLIPYTSRVYNIELEPKHKVLHNIHIGKIWEISGGRHVKPAILFKTNGSGLNQLDVSFRYSFLFNKEAKSVYLKYRNEFWLGFIYKHTLDKGYESPLSISPSFGFTYNNFTLSYLYDFGLSTLNRYHYGTHQISIGIKFMQNYRKVWSKYNIPYFEYDF